MQNGVGVPPWLFDNIKCAASAERLRNTDLSNKRLELILVVLNSYPQFYLQSAIVSNFYQPWTLLRISASAQGSTYMVRLGRIIIIMQFSDSSSCWLCYTTDRDYVKFARYSVNFLHRKQYTWYRICTNVCLSPHRTSYIISLIVC
jgi:hypothetical protein